MIILIIIIIIIIFIICILVIIFLLRILYHFVPSLDFIGQINGALSIIQNALLAIVVFFSGINYALSIRSTGWRIFMVLVCVVFAVLVVLGFLYL